MRKTTLFLIAGLVVAGLGVCGIQRAMVAPTPEGSVAGPTPPGIKVGVRVAFGGHASASFRWNHTDGDKSPVVVAVKGNWVQLKGIEPEGYSLSGAACWVNFDTVAWYVVLPK